MDIHSDPNAMTAILQKTKSFLWAMTLCSVPANVAMPFKSPMPAAERQKERGRRPRWKRDATASCALRNRTSPNAEILSLMDRSHGGLTAAAAGRSDAAPFPPPHPPPPPRRPPFLVGAAAHIGAGRSARGLGPRRARRAGNERARVHATCGRGPPRPGPSGDSEGWWRRRPRRARSR
jgi:hypothetical protein